MLPYVNEKDGEETGSESPTFYDDQEKKVKWYNKVLLNRESKVAIVVILIGFVAPVLIYHFVFASTLDTPPTDGYSFGSCLIGRSFRIDCGFGNVTEEECHPECCYDFHNYKCFHRFPSRFSYILDEGPWTEESVLRSRISTEPFAHKPTVEQIKISINEISTSHLSFTLYDANVINHIEGSKIEDKLYSYNITDKEALIEVWSEQGLIFSTIRGPLIAANNIWEMSFKLTNETMFGLGEIPLRTEVVKTIYSHKDRPDAIPLLFAKYNNSFHGFLIDCDTPTEITILDESQVLLRTIGVQTLKFHIFVGPTPKDIMNDVLKFINFNNKLEYWMFGAHVCSELENEEGQAQENLELFLEEAQRENFIFESHCGVAPVVFNTNYELSAEIENAKSLLRRYNKRFIPHVAPYIHYITEEGKHEDNDHHPNFLTEFEDALIRDIETGNAYIGIVDEKEILYLDYEFIDASSLLNFLGTFGNDVDGVILHNSWPLDESVKEFNETYLILPYFNQKFENAFNNTPLWNTLRPNNETYMYKHNTYGNNFIRAIDTITNDSFPIWSTSQWMNGDIILNRQNVNTSWASLNQELIEASLGGISGQWFWSTPICGDTEDFDVSNHISICLKWYMAATFMPLIKIHSKVVPKHPLAFQGINRMYMMNALNTRLSLLPYFYTTLQTGPLLRPMFYQYPDSQLFNLTTQFSVGDDLIIVPNYLPRQSHVNVWMPPGGWYELWSGLKIEAEEGEPVDMATIESDFLTLIEAGKILVLQKELQQSTELTRLRSNFAIIIALLCSNDDMLNRNCYAEGKLYLSPDISLLFKSTADTLSVTAEGTDFEVLCDAEKSIWSSKMNEISVYGLDTALNNYDNLKRVTTSIEFCDLQLSTEIHFNFVNS